MAKITITIEDEKDGSVAITTDSGGSSPSPDNWEWSFALAHGCMAFIHKVNAGDIDLQDFLGIPEDPECTGDGGCGRQCGCGHSHDEPLTETVAEATE